jgi:GT2 family glycosyltransferase
MPSDNVEGRRTPRQMVRPQDRAAGSMAAVRQRVLAHGGAAWRWAWSRLPNSALPYRIRLGGLIRQWLPMGAQPRNRALRDPRDAASYQAWLAAQAPLSPADRAAIAAHVAAMPATPLISVVMPVHEPPAASLLEAIASVRAQLYPHWELCIADDASRAPHVARILADAAAADRRIRWVRRDTNGHISAATNTALALATGEFVALMDHDDLLAEHALYAMAAEIEAHPDAALVYSDEDKIDGQGRRYGPNFKPDFDPDLLFQQNVVSHLGLYRRDLLVALGGLREGFEGSQDHDLALRFSMACGAARVRHIPFVLYHWRQSGGPDSFSQKALDRCVQAGRRAIAEALATAGAEARLETPPLAPTYWRVVWPVPDPAPLVSIIVPTRDHAGMLAACAEGVLDRTDYPAIELIIVDNGSEQAETLALFDRLAEDPRVRILSAPGPFNYAALNNRAAAEARGDILLLLNNDIEVISAGWLRELVSQALRPDVGAVGAKLLYADDTLQHGGVVLGLGGVAGHYLTGAGRDDAGNSGSLGLVREVSAATAACLALRRGVFEAVGGFDAANLPVAFNDVDLCLRIRAAGWRILWTPFAELYHLESASRGSDLTAEKARRFAGEVAHMQRRWGATLAGDPFGNPNLNTEGPVALLAARPPRFQPWTGVSPGRQAMPPPPPPTAAPASRPVPVPPPRHPC